MFKQPVTIGCNKNSRCGKSLLPVHNLWRTGDACVQDDCSEKVNRLLLDDRGRNIPKQIGYVLILPAIVSLVWWHSKTLMLQDRRQTLGTELDVWKIGCGITHRRSTPLEILELRQLLLNREWQPSVASLWPMTQI